MEDGSVKVTLQFVSLPHGLKLELGCESVTIVKTLDRVSGNKTELRFE